MPRRDDDPDFVEAVARGLDVLKAFGPDRPRMTLAEVAARTGLARPTARRILRTLIALGYVRADDPAFALTPRVLELGFSYLSALSLPEIVQPHLEALSHRVDEYVSAAVLDGADIVYIARVATRRIMSVRITIGTRFPAYATSMGRVLLAGIPDAARAALLAASTPAHLTDKTLTGADLTAELDRVRAQGWAMVDGELEPGLRSIAAPVHGRDGEIVGALNVSTSTNRVDVTRVRGVYLPALRETAAAVDAELRLV